MANISCSEAASEVLRQCIAGEAWSPDLVTQLASADCKAALFHILAEGLADRFEPRLCDDYAAIFSQIMEQSDPQLRAADLWDRYQSIRGPRVCNVTPQDVVVLSRVTLGADVAITSVILDALKTRFPKAAIWLAGSAKSAELFAGDPRVQHLVTPYPRDAYMRDRIACWRSLSRALPLRDTIVVDPDSRLTQLGLLPLGPDDRYFFFESRAYGYESDRSLGELAAEWASITFQVEAPVSQIRPPVFDFPLRRPCVTVSLGTGGNSAKSLPEDFESDLVKLLCSRFADVVVDEGSGAEEASRVARAVSGTRARTFQGSFAGFASIIARSDCYVGYDSAGQHAAAAAGTPLLTLFKGFVSERMFARWQPAGSGPKQVLKLTAAPTLDQLTASLDVLSRRV